MDYHHVTRCKNSRGPVVRLVLVLTFIACALEWVTGDGGLDPDSVHPCSTRDPLMDPTHEVRYGQDVIWQIPPKAKAILFMAHGGSKGVFGFFDPGPRCPKCYGLPEDRSVVLEALRRNYAVITVKSVDMRGYQLWPLETSQDFVVVSSVLNDWTKENSLENLPLAAFGHSRGGLFITMLTLKLPIRALVLMCSAGLQSVIAFANSTNFPPSIFALMPLDEGILDITSDARHHIGLLRERGVYIEEKECWPKPLSPLFFTERILCVTNETSGKIYAAYRAEGWLDANDYLLKNPKTDDWEAVLRKRMPLPFCTELGHVCLNSHVEQELAMAAAIHSLTSDANKEIYAFLDSALSKVEVEHSANGFSSE